MLRKIYKHSLDNRSKYCFAFHSIAFLKDIYDVCYLLYCFLKIYILRFHIIKILAQCCRDQERERFKGSTYYVQTVLYKCDVPNLLQP